MTKTQEAQSLWTKEDLISVYTRAQAIDDGVLVDVSETAKEAGITYPVAVTQRVWDELITPDDRSRPCGQSETGRLWDVVWMFKLAARSAATDDCLFYKVAAITRARQRRVYMLKAMVGGGDNGEPVITVMFPDED